MATAVDSELAWWWWSTLGAGLVVILAVVALLEILVRHVRGIHDGLEEAWVVAGQLAAHTSTTWILEEAANRMAEVERALGEETRRGA